MEISKSSEHGDLHTNSESRKCHLFIDGGASDKNKRRVDSLVD